MLPRPRHGIVRKVRSSGRSIFAGVEELASVQYHSLYASMGFVSDSCASHLWSPCAACPALRPLAWDFEGDNLEGEGGESPDGLRACLPRVLMAVEHIALPFFGVQFHAESICSSEDARIVVDRWWDFAVEWNLERRGAFEVGMSGLPTPPWGEVDEFEVELELAAKVVEAEGFRPLKFRKTERGERMPVLDGKRGNRARKASSQISENGMFLGESLFSCGRRRDPSTQFIIESMDIGGLTVPSICQDLGLTDGEIIVLDSELHQRPEVGETSIIGVITPQSLRLEYNVGQSSVRRVSDGVTTAASLEPYGGDIFSYLKAFMKDYKPRAAHTEIPFWGGLMGYINYEACLETIGIRQPADQANEQKPDIRLVFIERSIVLHHPTRKLFIQSINPADHTWVSKTFTNLQFHTRRPSSTSTTTTTNTTTTPVLTPLTTTITLPSPTLYKSHIRSCLRSICAGDSYELCLTAQTSIKTRSTQPSWPLYQRLRTLNPSPFSAYLHFGGLTLLGSSPERFLSWSRPTRKTLLPCNGGGGGGGGLSAQSSKQVIRCQFRPIKGTVKKRHPGDDVSKPAITLAEATKLLATKKERAENLMIVDLIRHDLHGVVGPAQEGGKVWVRKLMGVEEYETVFQLVSVVEGEMVVGEGEEEGVVGGDDDEEGRGEDARGREDTYFPTLNAQKIRQQFAHILEPSHQPSPLSPSTFTSSSFSTSSNSSTSPQNQKAGIDILRASLPPGSMTGAPKLRSCQLLRGIEDSQTRGLYAGVVGYLDVGGAGDWSVVIRSAVRWSSAARPDGGNGSEGGDVCGDEGVMEGEEEGEEERGDVWQIGAGGAVTGLSCVEGEWEEMRAKLGSTLRVFGDGV